MGTTGQSIRVGFIGVGNMGSRIVDLLLAAGFDVTLWARRAASLKPFQGRTQSAGTPADLGARSDVVGICVWDERDVEDVLLSENGVLGGMESGAVVVVHSTIAPSACRRLSQETARRGVALLDAPVSVGANVPKLLVMVGGEGPAVARVGPVLESFGDPVVHLGPVGSGQIAKLVNNTLLAATVGLADAALTLGAELGLDRIALLDVLSSASSRGTWTSLLGPQIRGSVRIASGRTHEWASKDVALTESVAAEAGCASGADVLRIARAGAEALW